MIKDSSTKDSSFDSKLEEPANKKKKKDPTEFMEVFSDEKSEAGSSLAGDSEFDDEPKIEISESANARETKTLNKGKDSSKSRRQRPITDPKKTV